MSGIILPTPITTHPLDALNMLGHLRIGNIALNLNLISETEHDPRQGEVSITMASGERYRLEGDDAKSFLDKTTAIANEIMRRAGQQIQTDPPGTR